ncbi:hypothetical protein C8R46DRAFT_1216026 [Mycena filopes]|nr:hypothetical protein C8R46DRAFT_1216026 [Mycena filopes]
MPASTSLQSRISAFESLSSPLQQPIQPRVIPSTPPARASPSPSPPNLGRKSSLIDLKIDLRDWVLDDGGDSLIHFSPPKTSSVKPPKLPPRKPSLASLKTQRNNSLTVEHTYPPALDLSPTRGHTHGSSISSFHSVSLSDRSPSPATPNFPPNVQSNAATPTAAHHTTGSSATSSKSSFEELSASAALASPTSSALISQDWEKAMARRPPKLPARPSQITVAVSPPPVAGRRSAPPPPPDRAPSIRSFNSVSSASSRSSHSPSIKSTSPSGLTALLTSRPPPIPPAPRKRYDTLFASLVSVHAPQPTSSLLSAPRRRAAGWRGLSVDLIRDQAEGGGEEEKDGGGDVLPGPVVRVLWARSRLPLGMLSAIWTDCDPHRTGALDREAFARGMWRIDEELRRAAASRSPPSKSAPNYNLATANGNAPRSAYPPPPTMAGARAMPGMGNGAMMGNAGAGWRRGVGVR